jgi:hypothetical protein
VVAEGDLKKNGEQGNDYARDERNGSMFHSGLQACLAALTTQTKRQLRRNLKTYSA